MALEVLAGTSGRNSFIKISSDIKSLEKELKKFGRTGVPKANVRAMNSAVRAARTSAKREVAAKRNLTAATADEGLSVVFATPARMSVQIKGKGRMLALTALKGGVSNPKQQALGVKVRVSRGRRTLIRGAFIARMRSGHVGVFQRTRVGGGERVPRLPIQEDVLPSIAHTLVDPEVRVPVLKRYGEVWEKTIDKQYRAAIRRANARIKG